MHSATAHEWFTEQVRVVSVYTDVPDLTAPRPKLINEPALVFCSVATFWYHLKLRSDIPDLIGCSLPARSGPLPRCNKNSCERPSPVSLPSARHRAPSQSLRRRYAGARCSSSSPKAQNRASASTHFDCQTRVSCSSTMQILNRPPKLNHAVFTDNHRGARLIRALRFPAKLRVALTAMPAVHLRQHPVLDLNVRTTLGYHVFFHCIQVRTSTQHKQRLSVRRSECPAHTWAPRR